MLNVQGLCKSFNGRDVLKDITLSIASGEVVGLIGRSGVGKSTLARCLTGLEKPDAGEVFLGGERIKPGRGRARQHIQYLWQDSAQSLSPYLSAQNAVLETFSGFCIGSKSERQDRAAALLSSLGLSQTVADRRPHALSGGQCQRVALARALAAEPEVLILDEPLSSLDLATQVVAIELLRRLHGERGVAMIIVSHDLAHLRQLADRIVVLDDARIVEDLPMHSFCRDARHLLSRAYAATLA